MTDILRRPATRLSFALLLIVCLISLAAPGALAFENSATENKATDARAATPADAKPVPASDSASAALPIAPPTVAYVVYSEAMKLPVESPAPIVPSLAVSFKHIAIAGAATINLPPAPLPPRGGPAVSTAPMTPGEKFKLFIKKSFLSPGAYALSIFTGAYGEFLDNDHHHHSKPGDFAADTMTRAARSFAFRATANFFEKFAYTSIFRQDPRYHRSDKRGAGAKIAYAVSRIFVTQGDRCGCDQFNASFLFGGLSAAGISNLWERDERMTIQKTISRWGTHVALTALTNILREFIGGQ